MTQKIGFSEVIEETKKARSRKLRELSDALKSNFILNNLNKSHKILIEGFEDSWAYGYSENYIKTLVNKKDLRSNDIVRIKAVDVRGSDIIGIRE